MYETSVSASFVPILPGVAINELMESQNQLQRSSVLVGQVEEFNDSGPVRPSNSRVVNTIAQPAELIKEDDGLNPVQPSSPRNVRANVQPASNNNAPMSPQAGQANRQATSVEVGQASYLPEQSTNSKELESYQVRALVRKTFSYQKRQKVSNVCCVSLCPLLMVAMSALLGILITNLISTGTTREFVYCSNANAMTPANTPNTMINSTSIPTSDGATIPGGTPGIQVKLLNFLTTPVVGGGNGPPSGGQVAPCVLWLESSYTFKEPYERDPFAGPGPVLSQANRRLATSGSIFQPEPRSGWLSATATLNPAALVPITSSQQLPWVYLIEPPGINIGKKEKKAPFTQSNIESGLNEMGNGGEGLLGNIQTRVYTNISSAGGSTIDFGIENYQPVPYIIKRTGTEEDMDDDLANIIRSTLKKLSQVRGKEVVLQANPDIARLLQFQNNVGRVIQDVPWGTVSLRKWDESNRRYEYVLQFGRDQRIARAASFPAQGLRQFLFNSMFTNALMKTAFPGSSIVQGLRAFPSLASSAINLNIGSLLGRILYPFGVSFLLPIFVITLVKEKEDRIQVMMLMNGLKLKTYYLAHWLHFFSLHVISSAVFLITGVVFKLQFFTLTDTGVLIILFLVWGFAQISLAFFLSAFFSRSRNALIVTFLLVLLAVIVNVSVDALFTGEAPSAYLIYPAFAFYRALTVVNTASSSRTSKPYTIDMIGSSNEVGRCIIFMIFETFIYLFLAYYLSQVLPSQYGVQRKWDFMFTYIYDKFANTKKKQEESDRQNYVVAVNEQETEFEDDFVKAERSRIDANKFNMNAPLIVRHMRKIYPGTKKIAVKDVTFAADVGEVFGLLGPNGAGKTSLISILTGLYEPTMGEAKLGGFELASGRKHIYRITGICPQHDILWDDLTVGEHILFYARLKGVPPAQEEEAKDRALEAVSLSAFENRLSKGLSGGEKRRLSIAIALTGDPRVVFFDEPTTGLDPEVRRLIWTIITKARKGKTIVLTTHSMEEAEVLCSRLAIMAKGTCRTIGSQMQLKAKYGAGFKLTYIAQPKNMDVATQSVKKILPANATIVDSFSMSKTIEFTPAQGQLNKIFSDLQVNAKAYRIDDWGISQTSLEEIFLRLISETDAEGSTD